MKFFSRQASPEDWYTTQAPNSPSSSQQGCLILSNQKIPALPDSNQGIILPGGSQDSFIFSHLGFICPLQDSSSAHMRIHHVHIINIDITYIASCIMTLHTTNSLPFQERSVDRLKLLNFKISENSSRVLQVNGC